MKSKSIILFWTLLWVLLVSGKLYAQAGNRPSVRPILIPPGLAVCFPQKGSREDEKYPLYLALDNNPATTWVTNHRVALFEFLPLRLKKIDMALGYTKSKAAYRNNRRPETISYRLWSPSEKNNIPQPITDWIHVTLRSSPALPSAEAIFTQIPITDTGSFITAVELKVVKGMPPKAKSDDICISEIRFYGIPEGYQSGYSVMAESEDWIWPSSSIPGVDLEGDRLHYDFDSIDGKFSRFTHQHTGGATSTFQGSSQAVENGYRLQGKVITSSAGIIDREENFDRVIRVIEINPFMALIDGRLFVRRQTLRQTQTP